MAEDGTMPQQQKGNMAERRRDMMECDEWSSGLFRRYEVLFGEPPKQKINSRSRNIASRGYTNKRLVESRRKESRCQSQLK